MGGRITVMALLGGLVAGAAGAQPVASRDYIMPDPAAAAKPMLRLGPAEPGGLFAAGAPGAIDFSRGVPGLPLATEVGAAPGVSLNLSAPTPGGGTASLSLTLRSGDAAAARPGSRMSLLQGD